MKIKITGTEQEIEAATRAIKATGLLSISDTILDHTPGLQALIKDRHLVAIIDEEAPLNFDYQIWRLSEHDRLWDLLAELDVDFTGFEHEPEGYKEITIEPMRGRPVLRFDLASGAFVGVYDVATDRYHATDREDIAR